MAVSSVDINCINALKAGDTQAFTRMYNLYSDKVYFFFLSKTRSPYLAEELLQQTFVKCWTSRENLSVEYPVEVQLFRTGRSLMIDALRKAATERKAFDQLVVKEADHSSLHKIDAAETKKIVDSAMQKLPAISRKIFDLNREEGLTYNQIAALLSISPKTVEYHISKVMGLLRKSLLATILLLIR